MNLIDCIVVGDADVGVRSLLNTYFNHSPLSETLDLWTTFTVKWKNMKVNDENIRLSVSTITGQEIYSLLRPMSYDFVSVFVLCFSLVDRESLKNVSEIWYPELKLHKPDVPIILVGTKQNLRDSEDIHFNTIIQHREGVAMAEKIKAVEYLECSAQTLKDAQLVFETCAQAGLNYESKPKKKKCCDACIIQ